MVSFIFIIICSLIFLQTVEPEQLSNPNKTRARGPAGRRPPSFKHSKHARRQKIGEQNSVNEAGDVVGDDIENNNVAVMESDKNEYLDSLTVNEEIQNDNLDDGDGDVVTSLKRRLWNSCQII